MKNPTDQLSECWTTDDSVQERRWENRTEESESVIFEFQRVSSISNSGAFSESQPIRLLCLWKIIKSHHHQKSKRNYIFCSIKLHISSRNMDSSSIPPLYDAMDNVDISSPMDDSDIFQSAIQVCSSFITILLFLFFSPSILFFPYRARFIEIRFALGRSEWIIRSSSVCFGRIFRAFSTQFPAYQ